MFGKRKRQSLYPFQGKQMLEIDSSSYAPTETDLTQVEDGTLVKVIELRGGPTFIAKLDAMEIVPGTILKKKTSTLRRGPLVIERGKHQLALGYKMAQKIIVEPQEQDK